MPDRRVEAGSIDGCVRARSGVADRLRSLTASAIVSRGSVSHDIVSRALAAARRAARCVRDVARGATGTHAYDQFLAHWHEHHPDRAPPSREEFFREDFAAKWNGVRRCC